MVAEVRLLEPEEPPQRELERGARREIAPADDARHAAARVVDDRREVIGGHAVAPPDDGIAERPRRILPQVESALLARRDLAGIEPHAQRLGRRAPARSREGAAAARARVARGAVGRGLAAHAKLGPRARARVEPAQRREPVERVRMLGVRGVLLLDRVEGEAEPVEIAAQPYAPLGARALGIEVLEAQHVARAARARVEPAEERGEERTRMRRPRRRGCEATDLPRSRHAAAA